MPPRVEALVEPSLLRWARESAGLDSELAAKKAGVKPERLGSWEAGERRPTIVQLRKLAHIYRRPIAVFYLPEPPADIPAPRDFRRLPGEVAGVESPELRYEIRRAVTRREIALELLSEEGEEALEFPLRARLSDDPDDLASRVRDALGVDLRTQYTWRGTYDPFNGWRAAIEEQGVLVLQMVDVDPAEARGFSISEMPLPAVVANIKDAPRGRTFTLLHELTHVILRQGGLCDLDDLASRPVDRLNVEKFCNRVAGAVLIPRDALLSERTVRQHGRDPAWTDEELRSLAQQFGASREAVLRRLLDLGRTNEDYYRERREGFLVEYEEARRRREAGFAPPHQIALASAGPAFSGLVLSSYAHGNITASDVSDYLGIRLKHLARIEQQLVGRAPRR
jgi:Zn-dependent peptidase ImmA (M78 family)/DNA-binding XRE family transcriptional regulator